MNVFGANMVYQPPKVRAQIELRARRASGYLASDSPLLPAKDDDRATPLQASPALARYFTTAPAR